LQFSDNNGKFIQDNRLGVTYSGTRTSLVRELSCVIQIISFSSGLHAQIIPIYRLVAQPYRVYHLKLNATTIICCGSNIKSEAGPHRVIDCPNLTRVTRIKATVVTRPLFTPVAQTLCGCEHDVFTNRTCVHFLTLRFHRNRWMLFVKHLAVRILTRKYRIRPVHRLVTEFRDTGSVCDRKHDGVGQC
jgi:hypothetical protein